VTHVESLKLLEKLEKQRIKIFTSNYVISECLNVLSQRFTHKVAVNFENDIYSGKTHILITIKEIEVRSREIFKGNINKDISYVDCTNIAFCEKYKFDKMITFDKSLIKLSDSILGI